MRRRSCIIALGVTALFGALVVVYRVWFHNPYTFALRLDADSVFDEPSPSDGLLIRDATLIDVELGITVPSAHVLIQGDSIVDVVLGQEPDVAEDVQVYDAHNKFVMPGLIDVHVHLGMFPQPMHGELGPKDALGAEVALEQFVRYGVTTVLVLGGRGANDEQAAELKRRERENAIIAPLLFATGDAITAPGSHPITTIMRLPADTDRSYLHDAGVTVIEPDDDPSAIIAKKKQLGLDGVKIVIEAGPPPWYPKPRMSAETASRFVELAGTQGLRVFAHAVSYGEFADAVRAGVDGTMHSVTDRFIEDGALIERMKQQGTYYVPTLSQLHGFESLHTPQRLDDAFLQAGVSRRTLRGLEHPLFRLALGRTFKQQEVSAWLQTAMRNLLGLHQQGVEIALGTDAGTPFNFHGFSAHVEMQLMARAGLAHADVLRAATINGAQFLGIAHRVGTVQRGRLANLLVLTANPLEDIHNTRSIETVILKGRVIHLSTPATATKHH